MAIEIVINPEVLFRVSGFPVTNTFLSSLIVVLFILSYCLISVMTFRKNNSNLNQQILETVFESFYSFVEKILGSENTKKYFGLIFSFFVFILISNWFGLLPFTSSLKFEPLVETTTKDGTSTEENHSAEKEIEPKHHQVHLFRAPTSDINTTLALAVVSVIFIQWAGFRHLGAKSHLKKYFNFDKTKPGFMGGFEAGVKSFASILELIAEFTKIISFTFRLFGNIFAGEVLLLVITVLSYGVATLPFLGLEIFVGFIQAFVFTMLTVVFLNLNIKSHH